MSVSLHERLTIDSLLRLLRRLIRRPSARSTRTLWSLYFITYLVPPRVLVRSWLRSNERSLVSGPGEDASELYDNCEMLVPSRINAKVGKGTAGVGVESGTEWRPPLLLLNSCGDGVILDWLLWLDANDSFKLLVWWWWWWCRVETYDITVCRPRFGAAGDAVKRRLFMSTGDVIITWGYILRTLCTLRSTCKLFINQSNLCSIKRIKTEFSM